MLLSTKASMETQKLMMVCYIFTISSDLIQSTRLFNLKILTQSSISDLLFSIFKTFVYFNRI